MNPGWIWVVIGIAFLDWYAIWNENERLNWFTKPAVILALLIWLGASAGFHGRLLWFGLALVFGLLGDIFLLLPRRFFFAGLVAFLLGHVAYIIGLWFPLSQFRFPHLILSILIVALLALIAPAILRGMSAKEFSRKLRAPVILYMLIISTMVFFAVSTLLQASWHMPASLLAALGGAVFFCSDSMLAYREFVQPFPKARFWVRVTYHLAQIALTAAALVNFSGMSL